MEVVIFTNSTTFLKSSWLSICFRTKRFRLHVPINKFFDVQATSDFAPTYGNDMNVTQG